MAFCPQLITITFDLMNLHGAHSFFFLKKIIQKFRKEIHITLYINPITFLNFILSSPTFHFTTKIIPEFLSQYFWLPLFCLFHFPFLAVWQPKAITHSHKMSSQILMIEPEMQKEVGRSTFSTSVFSIFRLAKGKKT